MSDLRTRFPEDRGGKARALGDEPILIDGMKVLFDTKVALFPVTLDPGQRPSDEGSYRRREREGRRD
jgi:hypothetical protein